MAGESGWTNRGLYTLLGPVRGVALPTNFFAALVTKQSELSINTSAAVNKGSGRVGIPVTGHGYSTGDQVFIEGTTNYNGAWLVHSTSSTNEVVITATFTAETFTGTARIHRSPGPLTNTLSQLTEIAAGNGYTSGGLSLTKNSTDFDTYTEDDTNNLALLQLKDLVWTASGGNLPASGNGARYIVLTDDNATVGSRIVLAWWHLGADRTVSTGQPLTAVDSAVRLLNPTT